jgi:hypothetical protein
MAKDSEIDKGKESITLTAPKKSFLDRVGKSMEEHVSGKC